MITRLLILSFCIITVLTKLVQSFSIDKSNFQRLQSHRTVFPFRKMSKKDSDTTTIELNSASKSGPVLLGAEDDFSQPTLILSLRHELQWIDNMQQQQPDNDDDNVQDNKMKKNIRLILASVSPRRREILDMMGLQGRFQVIPSPLNETALQQELMAGSAAGSKKNPPPPPMDYARILAEEKARALANDETIIIQQQQPSSSVLILASDTIVDLDGVILEKPKDATEAHDMLSRLSGAEHCVHTGVAIYRVVVMSTNDSKALLVEQVVSFTDTARVRFAPLSHAEIQAYIETKEPMDKAGSYGIQGMGGQFVTHVEGDFFTVMGLPMHRTSRALAQAVLSTTPPS